jgi:phosphoglycerate dehydrogenase-like enzyme
MTLVAVTGRSFSAHPELRCLLQECFSHVRFNEQGQYFSSQELVDFLQNSSAAIIATEKIDEQVLSRLPDLRVISKYGVGMDNIDLEACAKYGVEVRSSEGANAFEVAEHTLGVMIGLSRRLFVNCELMRTGRWQKKGGRSLSELTIGLVGFGHIGKSVAKLLAPFSPKLLVNDLEEVPGYQNASKEEIFQSADIVSLHLPLTEQTHNLVGEKMLSLMRPESALINTARGAIVDTNALIKALKEKRPAFAYLDVFASEPLQDEELSQVPNLFLTPHTAGGSEQAVMNLGLAAIKNLKEFKF